ncbi:MAG TPA: SMP-30/gluconolactonase/LRE family protein [Hyphomicrobiaceae bacterium]|nr:SMP-30/gluconolactonase/LRE family protein [Hyphomicrobiaceae bacterium]
MQRVQQHQFIDLAQRRSPVETEKIAVNRRGFLAIAAGLAAATGMSQTAFARNFGPDAPPQRYPEPDVVVLDKRFKYKLGNTPIQRLHTGTMWAEGPAWNGASRYLLWSDIPNDEILRWNEEDGHVGRRFRFPSGNTNGNTFDYQGRQISCQHGTRKVVRYEYNGKITVLAEKFDGKEFNAPNDAVVHPNDGSIWFTDPGYGSLMEYEGNRLPQSASNVSPLQKEAIYRIDGQSGAVTKVADQPFKPNGLCFSHDYRRLFVADTGVSHYPAAKSVIWVYDVDGATLKNPKTFASMELDGKTGFADGIRCDEDGNVWAGMGWVGDGYDGVHIFSPDGARIGQIRLPEICSNVCFGGTKRNRLFMTASQSLYAVYVETRGAHIT